MFKTGAKLLFQTLVMVSQAPRSVSDTVLSSWGCGGGVARSVIYRARRRFATAMLLIQNAKVCSTIEVWLTGASRGCVFVEGLQWDETFHQVRVRRDDDDGGSVFTAPLVASRATASRLRLGSVCTPLALLPCFPIPLEECPRSPARPARSTRSSTAPRKLPR